jgi:hypothetical protein
MILGPLLQGQILSGLGGTLFGAALGGAVTLAVGWLASRRERRLSMTLALYSEFHSPLMNELRVRAYDVLERSSGRPFNEIYDAASFEERHALSSVLHFFEKVALLMQAGVVNPRLISRLMRQYVVWWQPLFCLEGSSALQDPEWGETLRDVDRLFRKLNPRPQPPMGRPRQ